MLDRAALLAANEAFYDAFQRCDLGAMEAVWAQRSNDVCVHPGWEIHRGWAQIRDTFRRILTNGQPLRFELSDVDVEIVGAIGRVTAVENIYTPDGQRLVGRVACTNLFLRDGDGWRMTLHHGSPLTTVESAGELEN